MESSTTFDVHHIIAWRKKEVESAKVADSFLELLKSTRVFQPKPKADKSKVMKLAWRLFRTGKYSCFGEALRSSWKLSRTNIN